MEPPTQSPNYAQNGGKIAPEIPARTRITQNQKVPAKEQHLQDTPYKDGASCDPSFPSSNSAFVGCAELPWVAFDNMWGTAGCCPSNT